MKSINPIPNCLAFYDCLSVDDELRWIQTGIYTHKIKRKIMLIYLTNRSRSMFIFTLVQVLFLAVYFSSFLLFVLNSRSNIMHRHKFSINLAIRICVGIGDDGDGDDGDGGGGGGGAACVCTVNERCLIGSSCSYSRLWLSTSIVVIVGRLS